MSKNALEDAKAAYKAWREAQPGSYIESILADAIVRDVVPALIHIAERKPQPFGYAPAGVELESQTEIAATDGEEE